jgi:hypothetical protein
MQKRKKYLAALVVLSLFTGALPVFAEDLPSFYDWRLSDQTDRTSAKLRMLSAQCATKACIVLAGSLAAWQAWKAALIDK